MWDVCSPERGYERTMFYNVLYLFINYVIGQTMKNQLAENMRRFATKNLSEQIPITPAPERGPIENVLSALDMHIFRLQSDLEDWQAQYKNKLGKKNQ